MSLTHKYIYIYILEHKQQVRLSDLKRLTALLKIGGMLVCVEKEGEETKSRNILGVVRLNKKNRTWCSSNAKMHTQILRKLNSRFALEHRYIVDSSSTLRIISLS